MTGPTPEQRAQIRAGIEAGRDATKTRAAQLAQLPEETR